MAFFGWLRQRWTWAALTLIVVVADILAAIWVFTVPIFQSPDEFNHLDYALHIYERGGLFQVRRATDDPNYPPIEYHPTTRYLQEATRFWYLAFRSKRKVEAAYGTPDYFRRLDENAPTPGTLAVHGAPWVAHQYPCGYYTLLAGWLALLRLGTARVSALFFGCRLLSVLLLTLNLPLIYLTYRQLNLRPLLALSLTAIIGWFPLTTFVASYVQPDNLGWLLVTLSFYVALRLKRAPVALHWQLLLGLSLASLYLTKLHFFLAAAAAIGAMLAVQFVRAPVGWRPLARLLVCLAGPLLAAWRLGAWVSSGCVNNFYQMAQPRPLELDSLLSGFADAVYEYLRGGTFLTFWGFFGYSDTPLVFNTVPATVAILSLLYGSSIVLLVLALVRSQHILAAAMRIVRSGKVLRGLSLLSSNPLLNGLSCFAVFMLGLFTLLGNVFGAQGRNWLPFLPALFFVGVIHAPAALAGKRMQRFLTASLVAALLTYVGFGCPYALRSIKKRYYPDAATERTSIAPPLGTGEVRTALATAGISASVPTGEYTFRLDQPRFLYAFTVEYTLDRPDQSSEQQRQSTLPIPLVGQWWLKVRDACVNQDRCCQQTFLGPCRSRQTFFVNEIVDELKLVVPSPPFRFKIHYLEQIEPVLGSASLCQRSSSK